MTAGDLKAVMHDYLRHARQGVLSRLEGLSEYDLRRPLTPTGTNLLGVTKHLLGIEHGYLGETFGRLLPEPLPGDADDPWNNGDMWARPEESSDYIIGWYHRACAHADETIQMLELDSAGAVPHWPENQRATTLGAMMTRVFGEECAHGGHMAVVRELIDGRAGEDYTTFGDRSYWPEYVAKVQEAADGFAGKP